MSEGRSYLEEDFVIRRGGEEGRREGGRGKERKGEVVNKNESIHTV